MTREEMAIYAILVISNEKKKTKKREIFHNISYKIPLFQENSNSVFLLVEELKLQLLQIMLKNVFTI